MAEENITITREIEIAAGQNIKEYNYWLAKLSGDLVKTRFPFDYREPEREKAGMKSKTFCFADEIFSPLVKLCKGCDYTLHIALAAVLVALLNKYTGNDDIIVGTPIYRQETETGDEFINTMLALRNQLRENITFKQLLMQVKQTVSEAVTHQAYPVELLPKKLNMHINKSYSHWEDGFPLFDVVLLLENIHDKIYPDSIKPNMIFSFHHANTNREKYVEGEVEYNSAKYRETTIDRMINHFIQLLSLALHDINQPLSSIDILSSAEKNQLLVDFNDTAAGYPRDKTIQRLFAEQVESTPDHIALVEPPAKKYRTYMTYMTYISYSELNENANQLSRVLKEKGVQPDTIAAIMVERSLEMIIGILGILKAGGAYLPIDPEYPQERIDFMLKDSGAEILLKNNDFTPEAFNIRPKGTPSFGIWNLEFGISPRQGGSLAYIIYTSGTTGKPKGVLIEHRNVVRLMFNDRFLFDFSKHDVWTMFHSYCFDFSVWEMYGALLYGGKLVLIPGMTAKDPQQYLEILKQEQVTVLNQTPAAFYNLANQELKNPGKKLDLKYVIFGGEALKPLKLKKWKEKYPGTKLVNMFGITETTVHVTYKQVQDTDIRLNTGNIGKPIPTLSTYIMDRNLKLVPIGVAGELCVGGEGVARGYLNRPELTKEKFVENTYIPGQRLYRSGDLARLTVNGRMEYLGRIDHQVKIRGFRIEPGEIESQLLKYHEIKEAIVIPGGDRHGSSNARDEDKYLCAYIVLNNEDGVAFSGAPGSGATKLKEYLSKTLPDYMIPSFFVQLEKIPLTPNGKVDKKSLPQPEAVSGVEYAAPGDEVEEKLAVIWAAVLDLDKEKIGIDDNFFQMGGHSLNANILAAKIHKTFNVKLSLVKVFEIPFIKALSQYIKAANQDKYIAIEPAEKKEFHALSPAQKRLYVIQRINPGSTAYNLPLVVTLEGALEKEKIENSFRMLINRHESLRTSLEIVDGTPVQKVYDNVEFKIEYHQSLEGEEERSSLNCHGRDEVSSPIRLETIIHEIIRPFDLSRAPLLRVGLIKLPHTPTALRGHPSQEGKEDRYLLIVDVHHVITDGISTEVFIKEFMAIYEGKPLPGLRLQYKDYSRWQEKEYERVDIKNQEEYWIKQFDPEVPVLNLPIDYPRPEFQGFTGRTLHFEIPGEQTKELKSRAVDQDATLFMVLLALLNVLLAKLSGNEDIAIGTPIAGRRRMDLQSIIGMFAGTLVMRNYPLSHQTFKEFIPKVKERTLEAFENQDYPFENLVEKVVLNRDPGRNPLFDIMFALQNFELTEIEITGLKLEHYNYENRVTNFDLFLQSYETEEGLIFYLTYCTALFKKETVKRFITYFKNIISLFIENPQRNISQIEIISETEKEKILYDFNNTQTDYPGDKTIHRLFAEQVERTPDCIALKGLINSKSEIRNPKHKAPFGQILDAFGGMYLTYKELNKKSHQLAHLLIEKGVKPDTIVGIMVERSIEMIVGIFGILKAGGAYLPIDPEYPEERIRYMLEDSKVNILVNKSNFIGDIKNKQELFVSNFDIRIPDLNASNLAYIIYTSGSTGKPKGVMVEHRSLVNRLNWMQKTFPLGENDTLLQKTTFTFDVSVWEIFWWAIEGAALALLMPGGEKDPQTIAEAIQKNRVTHMHFVPSMLNIFLEYVKGSHRVEMLSSLKQVIASGEALNSSQVKLFNEILYAKNNTRLANLYGPTEATIDVSCFHCSPEEKVEKVPIGKPIDNIKLFVMNKDNLLQPPGVVGELCISGDGLARGYLNRPRLTAEKFVEHMSYGSYMSYIYKTGDLTRWLPDGNLEFLGRIDHQVKIRGYRIELGEIENQLLSHNQIKEAVVTAAERSSAGEKYLCAYFVSEQELPLSASSLREYLSKRLPGYMVPEFFIQVEKIALTANGKVDRKALPKIEGLHPGSDTDYEPPATEMEKLIANAWKEVLNLEKVGIYDKFFELGGNSMNVIQLNSKLNELVGKEIPVIRLFKYTTISSFIRYLEQKEEGKRYAKKEPGWSDTINKGKGMMKKTMRKLARKA